MCGIWSRTRFDQAVSVEELLHPVKMLRHRGPDGYGWFADENVALLHTRLSIIDITGGAQPLQSFDGRWIGVVNGELYDYESIRAQLVAEGVQFRTKSDSEVLLNLFAQKGPQSLAGLSGEFAFVFYDQIGKKLVFGRDPFGVKPLFYESRAESFTLASEMKALQDESPTFDETYVKTFLGRVLIPPRTSLKNVKHVWPGRVFTLDLKTKDLSWQIYQRLPLFQKRNLSTTEAAERLELELSASVKRRLRADVPVGCYLSGGIDSAFIAALAAHHGAKPKAFTVGFGDRDFDESKEAAHIASDLGIEHSVVQFGSKNFAPSLIRSITAFENPINNAHGAAKNLLAEHARKQVKVVLSGEGSDEWLGGYAYLRLQKLKRFQESHPNFGKNAMAQLLENETGRNLGHLDGRGHSLEPQVKKFFAGKSPAIFARLARARLYRYLTGDELSLLIPEICENLSLRLREENHSFDFSELNLDLWVGARTDLFHYVLANVGDRQEMSHSLEGRTPFLDPKVVEVASRIQGKDLIRGLKEKYILRKIAGKYLQPLHQNRLKKPFFAPSKYFYLRENKDLINSYIERSRRAAPWLNWKNIDHMLNSAAERKLASSLASNVFALRLSLFSLGVLSEHLRAEQHVENGFAIPRSLEELAPHRMWPERRDRKDRNRRAPSQEPSQAPLQTYTYSEEGVPNDSL